MDRLQFLKRGDTVYVAQRTEPSRGGPYSHILLLPGTVGTVIMKHSSPCKYLVEFEHGPQVVDIRSLTLDAEYAVGRWSHSA